MDGAREPSIVDITARHTTRTVFTRFITPLHADDRPGRWRRYFSKWQCTTRAVLPTSELELVPALRRFAPPARVIDKPAYSAFTGSVLASFLSESLPLRIWSKLTSPRPQRGASRPHVSCNRT